MSADPWQVRMHGGSGFSATVPQPEGSAERLQRAIRQENEEEAQRFERSLENLNRRLLVPDRGSREEREAQELSFGRRFVPEWNFMAISSDRYLRTLAGFFPELRTRLATMSAEIQARPEEFGTSVFDLPLWAKIPAPEIWAEAELTAAAFIFWVGSHASLAGQEAGKLVLPGLALWCETSRRAFATWSRNPYFPTCSTSNLD